MRTMDRIGLPVTGAGTASAVEVPATAGPNLQLLPVQGERILCVVLRCGGWTLGWSLDSPAPPALPVTPSGADTVV